MEEAGKPLAVLSYIEKQFRSMCPTLKQFVHILA